VHAVGRRHGGHRTDRDACGPPTDQGRAFPGTTARGVRGPRPGPHRTAHLDGNSPRSRGSRRRPTGGIRMTSASTAGSTSPLVITDFLYRARELFSDKTITQYHHGGKIFEYTYGDYADRVLRLAAALVDLGVRPG